MGPYVGDFLESTNPPGASTNDLLPILPITKHVRYLKFEVPKLIRAILGLSFPLHKAYPYRYYIGFRTLVPKMLVNLPQIMLLPKFLQTRSKIEGGGFVCRFIGGKI